MALGALIGGVGVCVVEVAAYMKVNDSINSLGGYNDLPGYANMAPSVGYGIFVGGAAGVVAALGGLAALGAKPAAVGAGGSQMPLLGLIAIVAIVGGLVLAWPTISKQLNGSNPTPPIVFVTPSAGTHATPRGGTATVAPSFLTRGYSTPEKAIGQWVMDQSFSYGGDCVSSSATEGYCSAMVDKLQTGVVYAVGGIGSEAEMWVLLVQRDGSWYVADVALVSAGSYPWH
jgi:hypothetical protein